MMASLGLNLEPIDHNCQIRLHSKTDLKTSSKTPSDMPKNLRTASFTFDAWEAPGS
jgi:hypothetical protein